MEQEPEYTTAKDAIEILGTSRQNLHYLRKHKILKDFKVIHAKCILYSVAEIKILKGRGYGSGK